MRPQPLLLVLDAPSEHTIFERYMARARGLAESTGAITVVISHRFSTVTGADLILVLDGGRLIEQGSHEETCGGGRPHGARRAVAAQAVIVLLCQKQVGVRLKNGSKFGFLRRF